MRREKKRVESSLSCHSAIAPPSISWRSLRARRDTAGSPSGAASGASGYKAGASTRANLESMEALKQRLSALKTNVAADGGTSNIVKATAWKEWKEGSLG